MSGLFALMYIVVFISILGLAGLRFKIWYEYYRGFDKYIHSLIESNVLQLDYNRLSKEMGIDKFVNSLDNIFKYEIDDLKMKGVGTAVKNENRAYFIVCDSDKLEAVRCRYELNTHDFHVTLGFSPRDVFGVRKNEVMKKSSKFLQLLAQEYYKRENWNFIKKIENYNLDPNSEVIPLKIEETFIKVKVDGMFMDIAYLDDKFWVVTCYSANEDLPRLSETEIAKKLK
jgi:hypothetical protein